MIHAVLLSCWVFCVVVGFASEAEPAIAQSANEYRIGPEDVLDIAIWKNVELTRTVPVRPDGMISLPF